MQSRLENGVKWMCYGGLVGASLASVSAYFISTDSICNSFAKYIIEKFETLICDELNNTSDYFSDEIKKSMFEQLKNMNFTSFVSDSKLTAMSHFATKGFVRAVNTVVQNINYYPIANNMTTAIFEATKNIALQQVTEVCTTTLKNTVAPMQVVSAVIGGGLGLVYGLTKSPLQKQSLFQPAAEESIPLIKEHEDTYCRL